MCNKNIFKNYIHKRSERDGFGAGGELMGTVRRRHPSEMLIRKSWNEVGRGLHQTVSGGGDVLPGWSRTLKVCQADLPPEPEETEEPWAEEAGPMECGPSSGLSDLGAGQGEGPWGQRGDTSLCSPPSFTITGPSQSPWSASFGTLSSSRAQPTLDSYKGSCGDTGT